MLSDKYGSYCYDQQPHNNHPHSKKFGLSVYGMLYYYRFSGILLKTYILLSVDIHVAIVSTVTVENYVVKTVVYKIRRILFIGTSLKSYIIVLVKLLQNKQFRY